MFSNNNAGKWGGAVSSDNGSTVSFEDNSSTKFSNNKVGGVILNYSNTSSFENISTTVTAFSDDNTGMGGAIYSYYSSTVSFEDNSVTVFSYNIASVGGGIYSNDGSTTFSRIILHLSRIILR